MNQLFHFLAKKASEIIGSADELIKTHERTHKFMMDLDKFTDNQLKELEKKYKELSKKEN